MDGDAIILTPVYAGAIVPPGDLGYPRVFSELAPITIQREVNINANRSRLQELYRTRLALKYPWVFLVDSDVVVSHGQLARLAEAWEPGRTPCLRTKALETSHVVCACCFMRGSDYLKVNYLERPNECQCLKLPGTFYVDGERGIEV